LRGPVWSGGFGAARESLRTAREQVPLSRARNAKTGAGARAYDAASARCTTRAADSSMLLPLVLYLALATLLVAGLIALSSVLGERHAEPATGAPFESGIVTIGAARYRVPARFYLVAALFVIFDAEAAFLYAWAVAARAAGWLGYFEALVFVAILVAALAYLWRAGALDWAPRGRRAAGHPDGEQDALLARPAGIDDAQRR